MILSEKYLKETTNFCIANDIPIINGRVSDRFLPDIKHFIQQKLEQERINTRRQEKKLKSSIGFITKGVLNDMCGKIIFSPIEDFLWDALEKEKLSFMAKRQYEIKPYFIDIAFPKQKLAIECDGREYHRDNILQLEKDQRRDKFLARKGWRTLRIEGIVIRRDINCCIDKIKSLLSF